MPQIYVFDAYGTLFDVHSAVAKLSGEIGPQAGQLSQLWRTKQLEYTWIHCGTGRYRSFRQLTSESLDFAIAATGGIAPDLRTRLLKAYATLDAYPEVPAVLAALKARGAKLAILSNGDVDMLDDAIAGARLEGVFDALISVSIVKTYKPAMRVYALATEQFGCAPGDITFLSSNRWDIAGAKAFGFNTVWINRSGAPDEYHDLDPGRVLTSLSPLAAWSDGNGAV